jgi:hypothetical protein
VGAWRLSMDGANGEWPYFVAEVARLPMIVR